eukprot:SAG11_NODE_967_length_6356_cov_6.743008_6_plen_136_part_00
MATMKHDTERTGVYVLIADNFYIGMTILHHERLFKHINDNNGMPQVSTPTAVPFAHIAIDKMHPPSADGGYDGILVVADHTTRFTILIPHKSTYTARENAQLLYKHVFSVFGIPEIRRVLGIPNRGNSRQWEIRQ